MLSIGQDKYYARVRLKSGVSEVCEVRIRTMLDNTVVLVHTAGTFLISLKEAHECLFDYKADAEEYKKELLDELKHPKQNTPSDEGKVGAKDTRVPSECHPDKETQENDDHCVLPLDAVVEEPSVPVSEHVQKQRIPDEIEDFSQLSLFDY